MLYGLDLFSGIGGITKALEDWVRPVAYCENDRYAIAVLLSRMADGRLPNAPIWNDVCTLKGNYLPRVDIIYGGFPCQDISVANNSGKGLEGERSGLFFEIERLVGEVKPRFVFLENVPAIRRRGGSEVVKRLAQMGYDCRWITLSASEVGANHKRERWWLLARNTDGWDGNKGKIGKIQEGEITESSRICQSMAHSDSNRKKRNEPEDGERGRVMEKGPDVANARRKLHEGAVEQGEVREEEKKQNADKSERSSKVADAERKNQGGLSIGKKEEITIARIGNFPKSPSKGFQDRPKEKTGKKCTEEFERSDWWSTEPNVGRVAHGIPFRVDRLKCLGNAVVPAQAKEAFKILMGLREHNP